MRILLYQWDAYGERALQKALEAMNLTLHIYNRKIRNHLEDQQFIEDLTDIVLKYNIDAVFSFNFFPLISEVCRRKERLYISWIFSCPHYPLYSDIVFYNGNYIFCFDGEQYKTFKEYGVENVFHLPLAVDPDIFKIQTASFQQKEEHLISFVGSLYQDERNYFDQFPKIPDYLRGYLDGICNSQLNIYGCSLTKEVISPGMWEKLKQYIPFHMENNFFLKFEDFFNDTMDKRVTVIERKQLLQFLANVIPVDLYTNSKVLPIKGINNRGYVDYYTEMPLVFYFSKINLNITLRSILSGIPLRVLDIMACRGFVLTNFQSEIAEFFQDGCDLAMFHYREEALEKSKFYLEHDDSRKKIALSGYHKILNNFSYKQRLEYIFSKIQ